MVFSELISLLGKWWVLWDLIWFFRFSHLWSKMWTFTCHCPFWMFHCTIHNIYNTWRHFRSQTTLWPMNSQSPTSVLLSLWTEAILEYCWQSNVISRSTVFLVHTLFTTRSPVKNVNIWRFCKTLDYIQWCFFFFTSSAIFFKNSRSDHGLHIYDGAQTPIYRLKVSPIHHPDLHILYSEGTLLPALALNVGCKTWDVESSNMFVVVIWDTRVCGGLLSLWNPKYQAQLLCQHGRKKVMSAQDNQKFEHLHFLDSWVNFMSWWRPCDMVESCETSQ